MPVNVYRLSEVEKERLKRHELRTAGLDDRFEPRHPNREESGRAAMRNLVRWRRKKAKGTFGKKEGRF